MDGELGLAIARTDFPNAKLIELPQSADFSQLILNVINQKADVVFLALAPARRYQLANPGKIKPVNPERPVRVFPVAILLPENENGLRRALNNTLLEMQTNGEIDRILDKYEEAEGSFLRLADPYQLTR